MSIISNTTVLSNFAAIDRLDILARLFQFLYISSEVLAEIQRGVDEGYSFYNEVHHYVHPPRPDGWIRLTSMATEEEFALFASLPATLHPGEASSLTIAHHRNWIFLTDDRQARREAIRQGIRLSGTLGCLLMAVSHQVCSLDEANTLLQHMMEGGYHSPTTDLSTLLT